jgi:hypothetical protein
LSFAIAELYAGRPFDLGKVVQMAWRRLDNTGGAVMTMISDAAKNVRFRLMINGEVKATAGLESFGVLSQTLSWVLRDPERAPSNTCDIQKWVCNKIHLRLGGLDSTSGEHLDWFASEIRVGDEISIQVLPPGDFDPPTERHHSTCGLGPRPERQGPTRRKRRFNGPSWRKGRG